MGTHETSKTMSRFAIITLCAVAAASLFVCMASEVEDLGVQPIKQQAAQLGESAKTKVKAKAKAGSDWTGALMTSGSFTMMASSDYEEEEEESAEKERDELGEANDWDISNGGKCEEG